jgi:chromosome segregation ATPase
MDKEMQELRDQIKLYNARHDHYGDVYKQVNTKIYNVMSKLEEELERLERLHMKMTDEIRHIDRFPDANGEYKPIE